MATITGFIERIKFRNEENGYTVMSVTDQSDGEEVIMVGNLAYAAEGDMIEASGHMTQHPVYGEQLQIESYEMKTPQDELSMERYLGSGAIKGIGAALAARIVRHFKADTFRIMEEEPERLSEVKGISEKMAMAISEQVEEKKEMRQAMMFLQEYGISMSLAVKIYQEYGPRLYTVIKENPYQLADDIAGVGFKMADEIAKRVGIFTDSDFRIKSGVLYTLLQATGNGHTYLPETDLLSQASELLRVEPESIEKHLMDMQIDKRLVIRESEGVRVVYASQYYYMEMGVARMLHDLNIRGREPEEKIRKKLLQIQKEESIELDEKQVQAVVEAVNSGLLIITGGPGTGKTTTINTIIRYFESEEMEILLAAPTGRAAKRMTEATGYEARTIHRLLEISGMPGDERSIGMHFERNEENPLDADAVIIDETSMVDIHLMQSLLKAVNPGTRLILVGDVNQLPSVGPGNVLKDVIEAGCFNVVMLTRIFRQASQSDIVVNAHKINAGETVPLGKKSNDFLFIKRDDPNMIINAMITLVQKKLPGYVGADPYDIQIMTPMRKGALGVERLNTILQEYLNPPDKSKLEKESGGVTFRVGDKVMQIRNNYEKDVYNGDIGRVSSVDVQEKCLVVRYDDRYVGYDWEELDEIVAAYAISIHKSQGSEYPAVVIPLMTQHYMLLQRNLIYTGVTRGKRLVVLVGEPRALAMAVKNNRMQKRYTWLARRLGAAPEAAGPQTEGERT